jgi:hypothetical protein
MITRTKVVIINGIAQSGKDTFVEMAASYCNANECANVLNISSVDPIKDMLTRFGWDGNKDDDVRSVIALIKGIWDKNQCGSTMFLLTNIMQYHMNHAGEDNLIFCHIREPENIDALYRIISGMENIGISVTTLLIIRGNMTDEYNRIRQDKIEDVSNYMYDSVIYNDSLDEYAQKVRDFVENLF